PVLLFHCRRGCRHRADVRRGRGAVPGRVAAAIPHPALHLGAGCDMVRWEGLLPVFPGRHGQSHGAPLPLRPTLATRLEGVPASVAHLCRDRGGGPSTLAAGDVTRSESVMRFAQSAKALLLTEFLSAFW